MDIETVKNYLKIDTDDEKETDLIQSFIDSSRSYLSGAIDNFDIKMQNKNFENMANLVMLAMISEWYDNRVYVKNDRYDKVSNIVRSMINQLQYGTYEVAISEN
ncbi:head-tail connector protein [Peptostreptococcus equinus]|uniref:Head-tail connector protein n=1 Tax=Peptostreptococcus equinus TaxID=3003601 RepID=A0ABY7JPD6_9FIRM|nr:head-tail connector protein [Peptostreptococcus sp. CBA3647]WAW14751.1 head-tail connector protein [Peptostreptococcus sp. CBA3647]